MTTFAGYLIYTGFVPVLRLFFTIFFGFAITKKKLFSGEASKGLAVVAMTISLPCLIFSSIVPAFNQGNLSAIGPLIMVAMVYEIIGLVLTLILRDLCWVPRNFQWGILLMGTFSNWGNLPTAIVQTVATNEPFDGSADSLLGVSFVGIFILIYSVTFFASGASRMCAWDYMIPELEEGEEDKYVGFVTIWGRRIRWLRGLGKKQKKNEDLEDEKKGAVSSNWKDDKSEGLQASSSRVPMSNTKPLNRLPTSPSAISVVHSSPSDEETVLPVSSPATEIAVKENSPTTRWQKVKPIMMSFLGNLVTPITGSLIVSVVIAAVNPLKALFVSTDGWTGTKMPNAPDGKPPLAFIQETASFLGAVCVPGALILLGATFARMRIPRPITNLPLVAIFGVTAIKMVILPVIGVFMVQALTGKAGFWQGGNQDQMLRFVAMLLSGTPAAVNQLVATQLYVTDQSQLDVLAMFLAVQYLFMAVASAALTAISLRLVS